MFFQLMWIPRNLSFRMKKILTKNGDMYLKIEQIYAKHEINKNNIGCHQTVTD